MIKSNKLYDVLKYIAQIFLPAAGTLYFGIAQAWSLSNSTQVVGTVVTVDTFLGVLLHLSSTAYNASDAKYDGEMNITEDDTHKHYALELNKHPEELDGKTEVTFKINQPKKEPKRS